MAKEDASVTPRDDVREVERNVASPSRAAHLVEFNASQKAGTDAKILPLLRAGHTQAEVARMVGVSPSTVCKVVTRNGLKTENPLARLLAYSDEAHAQFTTWASAFRPEWGEATPEQREELIGCVNAMLASARSFIRRLNKEAERTSS